MLNQPNKWELDKGDSYSTSWYYYKCFVERNNIRIRIDIDPTLILFNKIEVRINDDVVYKLKIIPLSNIFRLIIAIRWYIWRDIKSNIEDDNIMLIEELMRNDRDDVKCIDRE